MADAKRCDVCGTYFERNGFHLRSMWGARRDLPTDEHGVYRCQWDICSVRCIRRLVAQGEPDQSVDMIAEAVVRRIPNVVTRQGIG